MEWIARADGCWPINKEWAFTPRLLFFAGWRSFFNSNFFLFFWFGSMANVLFWHIPATSFCVFVLIFISQIKFHDELWWLFTFTQQQWKKNNNYFLFRSVSRCNYGTPFSLIYAARRWRTSFKREMLNKINATIIFFSELLTSKDAFKHWETIFSSSKNARTEFYAQIYKWLLHFLFNPATRNACYIWCTK